MTITEFLNSLLSKHKSVPTGKGTAPCETTVKIKHVNTEGKALPQGIKVTVLDKDGNKINGITDKNGVSTHLKVHCGTICWKLSETGKRAKGYDLQNGRMLLKAENTITSDIANHSDPKDQETAPLKIKVNSKDIPKGKTANEITATYTQIYIVIGFEVNFIDKGPHGDKDAFVGNTQNLGLDYGHAFFFTVKDDRVITFFSFGPNGAATGFYESHVGKEYSGHRPGNTLYPITERTKLFKFIINHNQLNNIKTNADAFTAKVKTGDEQYTAIDNDTCAETAKEILDDSGVETPSAKGYIKDGLLNPVFTFDIPYSWFTHIKNKYGNPLTFNNGGIDYKDSTKDNYYVIRYPWILKDNTLLKKQNYTIVNFQNKLSTFIENADLR